MRLHGPQSRFELALTGRPDNEGWFEVCVAINGPDGNRSATSRCLLATEVIRLAEWLEAASSPQGPIDRFRHAETVNSPVYTCVHLAKMVTKPRFRGKTVLLPE